MFRRARRFPAIGAALVSVAALVACDTPSGAKEPVAATTEDPVAALGQAIAQGNRSLPFHPDRGYLDGVLQALGVSAASQVLVHSRTSRQRDLVSPTNPRAVYFNDTTAVGWVPGAADLELVTFSPAQHAVVFYTLKQQPAAAPRFERGERCFECHTVEGRGGMQGWLIRSVPNTGNAGTSILVDDRTPLAKRWGGWFVTGGSTGEHLGSLPGTLGASYPAPGSDIGALTVLVHQSTVTNLIAAVHREASRLDLAEDADERRGRLTDLDARIADLADGLLFVGEAPLSVPLRPVPEFVDAFTGSPRRDGHRRPLRNLDLTRRLQRVRCSYMIDAAPFRALPDDVRRKVYRRMRAVLDDPASGISAEDRQNVLDTLADSLSEWRSAS